MPGEPLTAEELANYPIRVVVDQHGHYWRDYGDHWSMCPVSDENKATDPVYEFYPLGDRIGPVERWWTDGRMVNVGGPGDEGFVGDALTEGDAEAIAAAHNEPRAAALPPVAPDRPDEGLRAKVRRLVDEGPQWSPHPDVRVSVPSDPVWGKATVAVADLRVALDGSAE